jgi:broad specificity phosphatase PhoE
MMRAPEFPPRKVRLDMPRIYMIRHGKAAADFSGHPDPGLDPLGQTQASLAADAMAAFGPMRILSSPLARARERSEPLAAMWDRQVFIEPRVAEIPSPSYDLTERAHWLQEVMGGTWGDLGGRWVDWRDILIDFLADMSEDTAIFSHFIAINAAVGHTRGSDAIVNFRPDNCSITQFVAEDGRLTLEALGAEADTEVR